jgi:hypothetical protein
MRRYLIFSTLIALFAFSLMTVVHAPPTYTYEATSNYHGIDTPLYANVIVTASTTDPSIFQVTFLWKDAAENIMFTDVVPISGGSAQSTHQPDSIGDWGVQTFFQGPDGKTKEGVELVIKTRATSFNVIPEIPLIGTAGASIAMIGGLAFKLKRKNQNLK